MITTFEDSNLSIGINDIVPEPFRPKAGSQYYDPVPNQFQGDFNAWKKDVYILTDTQIIDIESSAFRLISRRREGTFDNIQGVFSDVPGFFYKLINMGNVVIETAGTQDTFTFDKVFDPASVNREIFNRWAAYQQREREKARDSTTSQVLEVLKEYHYLTQRSRPWYYSLTQ